MKLIIKIIKKITTTFFLLYSYNLLVPATALIPINIYTLSLIVILGLPGLLLLIITKITIL